MQKYADNTRTFDCWPGAVGRDDQRLLSRLSNYVRDLVATSAILGCNSASIVTNRHVIGPGVWRHDFYFLSQPKQLLVVLK